MTHGYDDSRGIRTGDASNDSALGNPFERPGARPPLRPGQIAGPEELRPGMLLEKLTAESDVPSVVMRVVAIGKRYYDYTHEEVIDDDGWIIVERQYPNGNLVSSQESLADNCIVPSGIHDGHEYWNTYAYLREHQQ